MLSHDAPKVQRWVQHGLWLLAERDDAAAPPSDGRQAAPRCIETALWLPRASGKRSSAKKR